MNDCEASLWDFLSSTSIPIPNPYIEILMPFLTDPEWKVLCYLMRHNSHQPEKRCTLSEFSSGCVAKDGQQLDYGTGFSKNTCRKALKSLCSLGLIIELAPNDPKHNEGKLYAPQLDIDKVKIDFLKARFQESKKRHQKRTKVARKTTKLAALESTPSSTTPLMSNGTPPLMSDGPPPLMSDGTPPLMSDGTTPLMSDGTTPIMSDGPPITSDGTPIMSDGTTPIMFDSSNLSEILHALKVFNSQIPNPLRAPRKLAAQLDARGETVESMEWAFACCEQNTLNPVKAFYLWIQSGQLPD